MSFWKTLGKIGAIAAPIVAAPFTGGASLALIGAGSGAALGALNGGGVKGTLLGAGLGGATAGLAGGLGGGAGAAAGNGAAQMGAGSALSQIGKNLLNPQTLASLGGIASGAAKGSAEQRIAEANPMVNAYKANLDATALGDKRAALASLLGGGLQDVQISKPEGSTIPTFGVTGGLRPSAMNQQALLERLSKPIAPLDMPQAGTAEKVLGGVGLGANILGALGQIKRPTADSYRTPPFVSQQAGVPYMPWTLGGGYS